ncbi:MAG: TetR family transcriptional regulator [Acidobacteriota bacterium]
MGRPRTFDDDVVLERATRQFWRDGYGATSVSELEAATGLGRKSLYNAFGPKDQLFLLALDLFAARAGAHNLAPLEETGATFDSIEEMLRRVAAEADTETGAFGCLICNTAREPISARDEVSRRITAYFERIEAAFAHALRGELARRSSGASTPAPIEELAAFLAGTLIGLCTAARSPLRPAARHAFVEQALRHVGRELDATSW